MAAVAAVDRVAGHVMHADMPCRERKSAHAREREGERARERERERESERVRERESERHQYEGHTCRVGEAGTRQLGFRI